MPNNKTVRFIHALLLGLSLSLTSCLTTAETAPDAFTTLVAGFADADFEQTSKIAQQIAASDNPQREAILNALASGNLCRRKSDNSIVITQESPDGYSLRDAASNAELGTAGKRDVARIALNNRLRGELKLYIAQFQLLSNTVSVREEAARNLLQKPDAEVLPAITTALGVEKNAGVRKLLTGAQAAARLSSADSSSEEKVAAVTVLGDMEDKAVISLLEPYAQQQDAADKSLHAAAVQSLATLRRQEAFYHGIENVFFGLSLGSILLLAAVGLAITFGVMGVINMAHGEMIMLGAYTTYVVQLLMPHALSASLFVAIPSAFIVAGATGILIEKLVIKRLYGRPLETLLATFGISLILQQLVRSIFSPLNRPVATPDWMSGLVEINGMLSLTLNRLYVIAFSLLVLLALIALLRKTALGLQMRAVTQNRAMASSMGINTSRVDALTFGLGSGIAGIAGVALSQLTNVGPNLGQSYIIDSFMVVVFGGVGNLLGTFLSAMMLGLANKFIEPLAGAVLAKILILVFIILFIQRRPRGLFALKGRFVED